MRTWPRAQEKRVPMAMRSSFELAAKMVISTRLRKMRSLFCGDSIVAVVVVVMVMVMMVGRGNLEMS